MVRFLDKSLWLAALCAGALLTGAAHAANDWQAGAGPEWAKVLAAAKQEGKVVVAGPPAPARLFSEGFKRDTGIDLEYLSGNSRELSARLSREVEAGHQTIDINLGGGTELLTLYPRGLLEPIESQFLLPTVKDKKYWADGKIRWMDDEGKYFLRGSLYVVGWPVFNTKLVPPSSVKSWKDLLKPEFKGKIAAYDPRTGGPGQGIAGYLAGTFGLDFFKAIYIGQNVVYTRDSQQLVEWAARGTYPVVLGSIQEILEKFRKQGLPVQAVAIPDGQGYLSSGFSVLKQAKGNPHPNAATVFINWYASKPGQEAYSRAMLEPSARTDVDVPEIPDYVRPKPGVAYTDSYSQEWYTTTRPKTQKTVIEALGGK